MAPVGKSSKKSAREGLVSSAYRPITRAADRRTGSIGRVFSSSHPHPLSTKTRKAAARSAPSREACQRQTDVGGGTYSESELEEGGGGEEEEEEEEEEEGAAFPDILNQKSGPAPDGRWDFTLGPKSSRWNEIFTGFRQVLQERSLQQVLEHVFTSYERYLVMPSSGARSEVLHNIRQNNRQRYGQLLEGRFHGLRSSLALKLTLLYLGHPVAPLNTGNMRATALEHRDVLAAYHGDMPDSRDMSEFRRPLQFLTGHANRLFGRQDPIEEECTRNSSHPIREEATGPEGQQQQQSDLGLRVPDSPDPTTTGGLAAACSQETGEAPSHQPEGGHGGYNASRQQTARARLRGGGGRVSDDVEENGDGQQEEGFSVEEPEEEHVVEIIGIRGGGTGSMEVGDMNGIKADINGGPDNNNNNYEAGESLNLRGGAGSPSARSMRFPRATYQHGSPRPVLPGVGDGQGHNQNPHDTNHQTPAQALPVDPSRVEEEARGDGAGGGGLRATKAIPEEVMGPKLVPEAELNMRMREIAYWTAPTMFHSNMAPVMPTNGPPADPILKSGGLSVPTVSVGIQTPTEQYRTQRALYLLRNIGLDRSRMCPFDNCFAEFNMADEIELCKHIQAHHFPAECPFCDEPLYTFWNQGQREEHILSKHRREIQRERVKDLQETSNAIMSRQRGWEMHGGQEAGRSATTGLTPPLADCVLGPDDPHIRYNSEGSLVDRHGDYVYTKQAMLEYGRRLSTKNKATYDSLKATIQSLDAQLKNLRHVPNIAGGNKDQNTTPGLQARPQTQEDTPMIDSPATNIEVILHKGKDIVSGKKSHNNIKPKPGVVDSPKIHPSSAPRPSTPVKGIRRSSRLTPKATHIPNASPGQVIEDSNWSPSSSENSIVEMPPPKPKVSQRVG